MSWGSTWKIDKETWTDIEEALAKKNYDYTILKILTSTQALKCRDGFETTGLEGELSTIKVPKLKWTYDVSKNPSWPEPIFEKYVNGVKTHFTRADGDMTLVENYMARGMAEIYSESRNHLMKSEELITEEEWEGSYGLIWIIFEYMEKFFNMTPESVTAAKRKEFYHTAVDIAKWMKYY